MGEVYRAQDTRLERNVAVKVLSRTLVNDAEALRRFEQEARAAGMLNHPNILAIYDIGVEGEQRYIVSELLEGQSLRARIREGPVPPRRALDYGAQLARGLAAAHERGIIHRDLKPENIFLTRDGHVKILDFGLVKLVGQRVPSAQAGETEPTLIPGHTEPGRIMGTVGYMAPEQIRGLPGDALSDIFAFGAILYEMLAGRPAFRGESPIETLNAILRDDPPDFFELNLRIPAALDRIVRHCLEKKPEERFQAARGLAGIARPAVRRRRRARRLAQRRARALAQPSRHRIRALQRHAGAGADRRRRAAADPRRRGRRGLVAGRTAGDRAHHGRALPAGVPDRRRALRHPRLDQLTAIQPARRRRRLRRPSLHQRRPRHYSNRYYS